MKTTQDWWIAYQDATARSDDGESLTSTDLAVLAYGDQIMERHQERYENIVFNTDEGDTQC